MDEKARHKTAEVANLLFIIIFASYFLRYILFHAIIEIDAVLYKYGFDIV